MAIYRKGEKIAGVYVIFGLDGRVYVGQSCDILNRPTVDLARRLGLSWTIIYYAPGTTRQQRQLLETEFHEGYRLSGFDVVSVDQPEVTRRAHANIDFDVRSAKMRASWVEHPERRVQQAERLRLISAMRTPEHRSKASQKGWETRRSQSAYPRGSSRRTQQRRRAVLARGISQ